MASPRGTPSGALDRLLDAARTMTRVFLRISEAGFAFVGVVVLTYILLGEASGDFVTSVIANLILLVDALTPQGLVGVAIVAALVYLAKKRI